MANDPNDPRRLVGGQPLVNGDKLVHPNRPGKTFEVVDLTDLFAFMREVGNGPVPPVVEKRWRVEAKGWKRA